MAPPLRTPTPALPLPIGPSVEAWRAMTPDERERFLIRVNDSLSDPHVTMSEGRPHKKAKSRAKTELAKARIAQAKARIAQAKARIAQAKARIAQAKARIAQAKAEVGQAVAVMRQNVLAVLTARGIPGIDDVHARVTSCDDLALLQGWLVRALSATSAADIFSEPSSA